MNNLNLILWILFGDTKRSLLFLTCIVIEMTIYKELFGIYL